jgi:hypothetical protein
MWPCSSARAAITMPHPESSNRNPPSFMSGLTYSPGIRRSSVLTIQRGKSGSIHISDWKNRSRKTIPGENPIP